MNRNKELVINMAASFLAQFVSMAISFFLSPYIVENIGVDAYGFVGLANNFISYAGLITIALNSMASRFVTIKIYEKDLEGASRYFTSVLYANLFLTAVMGAGFVVILCYLESLINVPADIRSDVKLLFATLFANCLISTVSSIFSVATFATNKLYLNSLRQIESNLIRVVLTVALFVLFVPQLSYIGITAIITTVYVMIFNIYYTKKLLPEVAIKRKYFDIKAIWEIVSSGVWNLINRLGQLLLDGVDLLITNIFINPIAMGVLSIAKIIPTAITSIIGTLVNVFSPNFTILYAEKKQDELVASVKQSMKIMGVISNIPIIILIVCGHLFFSLWQPTQDATELHILSVLTCMSFIISGGINCIFNIFTVVNKLKMNSLLLISSGLLNAVIVYILLHTTSLGIYAVAGVSSMIAMIKNLFFTVPYGAYCLGEKWYTFYSDVLRPVIFVVLCCVLCESIKFFVPFTGWAGLFALGVVTLILSVILGYFIILNRNDRKVLISKVRSRSVK